MVLFNLLIFILTLNGLIVDSEAKTCEIGEKHGPAKGKCEPCEDGTFQDTPMFSKHCKTCTPCREDSGSFVREKCTKEKNTVCGCHDGFSRLMPDYSFCQCAKGSGLENGVCSTCKTGFFSAEMDSICKPWKDCKSAGIKQAGTATSDAICNEVSTVSQTTTSAASTGKLFLSLSRTSHPHEGVKTQKTLSSVTTTTVRLTTVRHPPRPSWPSSNVSTHIGTAILILGIVGLLVLTAMTCKLHIPSCWRPKLAEHTKDSLCRRPVEESGDGSESSLKLNPEP